MTASAAASREPHLQIQQSRRHTRDTHSPDQSRRSLCDPAGQCLRSTAPCHISIYCNQCTSSSPCLCVVVAHTAFRRSFPAVFGASVFETFETYNAEDLPEESADIDGICNLLPDTEGNVLVMGLSGEFRYSQCGWVGADSWCHRLVPNSCVTTALGIIMCEQDEHRVCAIQLNRLFSSTCRS